MKVAIIGCGMIADAHVKEIKKVKNIKIIAVCDKEPMMAEQLAERFDIPEYFEDLGHLLSHCSPDVVHILTPPDTHLRLGSTSIEAGCHILMEKPFTVTADEAFILLEKAKTFKRKITVNYFHNFSLPSLRLRELVSKGILGEIVHMEGIYSYNTNSPVASALIKDQLSWLYKLPGTLIQNNIDHLIGKFVEFIPDHQPKVWACAKKYKKEEKSTKHSRLHDELRVMICGEDISAYATFSSNIQPFQHAMTIYGTKCSVSIDYESRAFVVIPTSSLPGQIGKLTLPFIEGKRYIKEGIKNLIKFGKSDFHFYAGANNLFNNFYHCIKNGTDVPIPYSNILKASLIIEEIMRQISANV